jgi:hypothetical protein
LGRGRRCWTVESDTGYWWKARCDLVRSGGIVAGGVFVVDGLSEKFLVIADSKVLEAVEILWFFFVRDVDQVLNSGV